MAHPLTHLTHGFPTRRPFHPAKMASASAESKEADPALRRSLVTSYRADKDGATAS